MNVILDRLIESEDEYTRIIESNLETRSVLYSLEPIGLGTPFVESLTSYIMRLATIHNVKVSSLIKLFTPFLDNYLVHMGKRGLNKNITKYINGNGDISEGFVKALENLTCRSDIQYLTMLNWKGIFRNNLIDQHRKWCPYCLEHMKNTSKIIYEPLIWYLSDVQKCELHEVRLLNKCPKCKKNLGFINGNSLVGYCSYCFTWLGETNNLIFKEPLTEEEKFININYQQLIAKSPELNFFPTKLTVGPLLTRIKEKLGFNNFNEMSRFLGVEKSKFSYWVNNKYMPTNNALLKIARKINTTIFDLIYEQKINTNITVCDKKNGNKRKLSPNEIEKVLKSAIKSEVPKSINQLAKEEGFCAETARNHYPELLKIIKDNYESYKRNLIIMKKLEVKRLLIDCLAMPIPISLSELSNRTGISLKMFRRYAPNLSQRVIDRNKEYKRDLRNRNIKMISVEIEKIILDLYKSGKYPSISEVKKRISKPNVFRQEIFIQHYKKFMNTLGYDL